MLLIHNPWGQNGYIGKWNGADKDWTDELVAQISIEFDPRTDDSGLFVIPIANLQSCFAGYAIAHNRDDEGYVDVWYDQIDTTDNYYKYQFKPPTGNGDLYMTVETYASMIVPL